MNDPGDLKGLIACIGLGLLLLIGCEPATTDRSEVAVRDSAGIAIILTTDPAWTEDEAWTISASPTLRLGSVAADTSALFSRVVDATRLSDGTIVIAEGLGPSLELFDRAGNHVRSIGTRGEGPGEFQAINSVDRLGDTLIVYDPTLRRLSRFLPSGQFLDDRNLGHIEVTGRLALIGEVRVLDDGTIVAREGSDFARDPAGSVSRDTTHFLAFEPESDGFSIIGSIPGPRTIRFTHQGRSGFRLQPLGPIPAWDAVGESIVFTSTDHFEVRKASPSGLELIGRRDRAPVSVDASHLETWSEPLRAQAGSENPGLIDELLEVFAFPSTLPTYQRVLVDPDGYAWAELFEVPRQDPGPAYDIFDGDGRYLGKVVNPEGFTALEFGPDYVLGITFNDLDVPFVELRELVRN